MPRHQPFLPLLLLVALPSLLALLPACSGGATAAAPGQGLVLLPYDGPLARGVKERDPRLEFHDFGRVPDGDTVTRVFRLRNSDPRPIAIQRVDPGCGCTVPALRAVLPDGSVVQGESPASKAPVLLSVPPGAIFELELAIHTRDMITKNTDKLVTVRLTTDSPASYFVTLELHILVEKPFSVVPGTLALGLVPESGGKEGRVEIVNAGAFAHTLGALRELPPGLTAELTFEERNFRPVWTLAAALQPPLERGPRALTLHIETLDENGAPGRDLEVPLTAQVVGDLASDPSRIVFKAEAGAPAEGTLELFSLLPGQRLKVRAVEVPEEQRAWLAAEAVPLEPDGAGASERWRIVLRATPPHPEGKSHSGRVRVLLDDPQHPEQLLDFVVHVR